MLDPKSLGSRYHCLAPPSSCLSNSWFQRCQDVRMLIKGKSLYAEFAMNQYNFHRDISSYSPRNVLQIFPHSTKKFRYAESRAILDIRVLDTQSTSRHFAPPPPPGSGFWALIQVRRRNSEQSEDWRGGGPGAGAGSGKCRSRRVVRQSAFTFP